MSIHAATLKNSEQRTLAFLKTGHYSSIEISKAVGIRDNTSIKDIKHLRDKGENICDEWCEKDGIRWKIFWWTPGVYNQAKEPLRQTAQPCPKCGSYYRRGDRCNVCGTIFNLNN